jgi:hypothetical protein
MAKKKNEVVQIKKDLLIKVGIAAAVLLVIIPLGVVGSRSIVYNNMNNKLQNVAYYSDLETIQGDLNFLPFDYRDSQLIRTELQLIINDMNVIRRSKVVEDYKRMRTSYYNLEALNNTLYRWDITGLLDNQDVLITLVGEYGTSAYFNLQPCGFRDDFCLDTNLPTDRESTKEYYYYHNDYEVFGYDNKNNEAERFDAFRVFGVYKDYIEIYNFKDKQIYTLRRND